MAEQVDLAALCGPEPARHRLRWGVFAIDAVHDFIEFEGRKRPVDRRPRRLDRITLAAKIARDSPANLETRPARRKPRPHPADIVAGGFFLDYEHTHSMQHPVPGHHGRVAPSCQLGGDGLAIDGDKPRGPGVGQHRRVRRDIGAAPSPQFQALGLDDGTVGLGERDAGLQWG
jgi:hypothetical protein